MNYRVVAFSASVLFALIFIMPVFMVDKTLIWDDWVWIYNSPEQLRDVAIQLGFWWLADLNEFIYTLEDPNFFLSSIAFWSHVVSIAVLGRAFVKLNVLDDVQCSFWAACCIVSPYVMIRYTNSVAFYNLWFACFVCAAYLYVFFKSKLSALLSAFLFLVSFSLNSLIPAFFLIVIFPNRGVLDKFTQLLSVLRFSPKKGWTAAWRLVWSRLLQVWKFALLPLVFYAIKLSSPYASNLKNPYLSYNLPQIDLLLWSPWLTLKETFSLLTQVLWYGLFGLNSLEFLLGLMILVPFLALLVVLKKLFNFNTWNDRIAPFGVICRKNIVLLLAFSSALVFPYVVVGKPPVLASLLEARHFLTAAPFILATAILVLTNTGRLLGKIIFRPRVMTIVLLGLFSSFCIWRSLFVSSTVWWENKVSNFIIDTVRQHRSDIKFWVFDNQLPESLGIKRWNYVYTGFLISAFGTKDNFGISEAEYFGWNQPVKLLSEPYFRHRYNIEDYVHQDSYNHVVIKLLKELRPDTIIFMHLAEMFGYRNISMDSIVSVSVHSQIGCVDEAISFFSLGVLNNATSSLGESTFCKTVLIERCKSIKRGVQEIPLNSMERAYAIQKYPLYVGTGGLRVFNPDTDFTRITEKCPLRGE